MTGCKQFGHTDTGRYTLNIWDVGGQKTIRSYWRNYFEQTDGLVWVVDSSDLRRLNDCKMELDNLLKEEVCSIFISHQLSNLLTQVIYLEYYIINPCSSFFTSLNCYTDFELSYYLYTVVCCLCTSAIRWFWVFKFVFNFSSPFAFSYNNLLL